MVGINIRLTLKSYSNLIKRNVPAVAPQPRDDDDGPGTGGPTPGDQAELCATPT